MTHNDQILKNFRVIALTILIIALGFILAQITTAIVLIHGGVTDINSLTGPNPDAGALGILKLGQFFSSFFSFLLPAIIVAWLIYRKPAERLKLNSVCHIAWYVLPVVILFFSLPWMNMVIKWNEAITFPECMSGLYHSLQDSEQMAKKMTELILSGNSTYTLLINILLVALLPALAEELMFRGIIQSLIHDLTHNKHVAVLLSAILFSAIHFQFFGFIPRFLLGAFFGYLVMYSGSLWPAILAHFFNNAMAVIVYFYINKGAIQKDLEDFGSNSSDIMFTLISAMITIFLIAILFRKFKSEL
ncbi:MAG: CPBP family intramembrane metalloprotease [Bacteroidales bacterium]|nr:CPBP family intramembrane metalloprotease [Bacteroidales bacterium]HOY38140.1 CPBP family intramembrane metalloprotease [Bacteroidales bacterium]HQP03038.1 CPBP family intramembrane metalloprotease [Bacteroidales bacterium]